MTRYGVARYSARHSGKSGFVTAGRVSSPKPFPFSFIEDAATSYYPEYRKYIPEKYQEYSDSYYDLRSKPYGEWYEKHGRKHIKSYMDYYTDALQKVKKAKNELRSLQTKDPTLSKRSRWDYTNKTTILKSYRKRRCTCRNIPRYNKNLYKPRQGYRSWKRRKFSNYTMCYKRYY